MEVANIYVRRAVLVLLVLEASPTVEFGRRDFETHVTTAASRNRNIPRQS